VQGPFYEWWKMVEKEVIEPRNLEWFQSRNPYYKYDMELFWVFFSNLKNGYIIRFIFLS